MSACNGVWMADGKIIGFSGTGLVADPHSEVYDVENHTPTISSLSTHNEVTMTFELTCRQVENLWVVYHNLHLKLACCPSRRVYHNAFNHHKARIREKNRKRAKRMIERSKK